MKPMTTGRVSFAQRIWDGGSGPAPLGWFCVLLVTVLATYGPVYQAGFIWDDDAYVINNETLRTAGGLWDIWFRVGSCDQFYPVVFTTFWLEYHAWGLSPLGYHVTNLVLHAMVAWLGGLVLRRLGLHAAWWVALIFAVHPVHVESVAWITERKNVLSACFYLGAMLAYLNYWRDCREERSSRSRWWVLSLSLYACALLSKSVTASLPAALLLLRWWDVGDARRLKIPERETGRSFGHWPPCDDWVALCPFFAVGLLMSAITVSVERAFVGASGEEFVWSFVERVQIAGGAVLFYIEKLAWPEPLIFFYPKWGLGAINWMAWTWPLVAMALLVAAMVAAWEARRGRYATSTRGILVAMLFFVGTLFPALGFFNVFPFRYSFVADHFQYLASWGMLALMVELASYAFGLWRDRVRSWTRTMSLVPVTLVLLVLAALSWRQCHVYRDLESLWTDTVRKNPDADAAWGHLSYIAHQRGDYAKAEELLRVAISIDEKPETLMNLARLLVRRYQIEPSPALAAEADSLLRRLVTRHPLCAEAWFLRADIERRQGRMREATEHATRAVAASESDHEYRLCLAELLLQQGQISQAAWHLEVVRGKSQPDARCLKPLARAYLSLRRFAAARSILRDAIRLSPDDPDLFYWLGAVCAQDGETEQARQAFGRAAKLAPGWSAPQEALAEL